MGILFLSCTSNSHFSIITLYKLIIPGRIFGGFSQYGRTISHIRKKVEIFNFTGVPQVPQGAGLRDEVFGLDS
jgi:hypothetical protein